MKDSDSPPRGPAPRLSVGAAAAVAVAWIWLAVALPITGQEAYAFQHFVRPPVHDLLGAFDPANRILNTLLMKRTVAALRLSAFSLRAPGLLGLALYLWAVAGLLHRRPRLQWVAVLLAGTGYLTLEYCTPGAAMGLGLALWVCAAERTVAYLKGNQSDGLPNLNLAGLALGLSVAANFFWLLPALGLAVAVGLAMRKPAPWAERLLATATVTAFLVLVLPFSHASAGQLAQLIMPPRVTARTQEDLTGLIAILRRESRGRTVRIAASEDLLPVLQFYQARYREGLWRIVAPPGQADPGQAEYHADYYVVDPGVLHIPGRILYNGHRVTLVQAMAR